MARSMMNNVQDQGAEPLHEQLGQIEVVHEPWRFRYHVTIPFVWWAGKQVVHGRNLRLGTKNEHQSRRHRDAICSLEGEQFPVLWPVRQGCQYYEQTVLMISTARSTLRTSSSVLTCSGHAKWTPWTVAQNASVYPGRCVKSDPNHR